MKYSNEISLCLLLATVLSGCAGMSGNLPSQPIASTIEPMPFPEFKVGDRKEFKDEIKGELGYWEVKEVREDGGIKAVMSSGCEWNSSDMWFAGNGSYKNCSKDAWGEHGQFP